MTTVLAALVVAAAATIPLRVWLRRRKQRRIALRRTIEQPNSHYSAAAVVRRTELERWSQLLKDESIHPINREEVTRLLALVEAAGPDVLSPSARQFLENMMRLRK